MAPFLGKGFCILIFNKISDKKTLGERNKNRIPSCCVNNESGELTSSRKPEDNNEVVIIIRDGNVVTFVQRKHNTVVEGVNGDGI